MEERELLEAQQLEVYYYLHNISSNKVTYWNLCLKVKHIHKVVKS